MQPVNSTIDDIDAIYTLYDAAIAYQKTKFHRHWLGFDRAMTENEIQEKRHWKIMVGDMIACIWSITYQDPFVWFEKDKDPSIYVHRIVTNPAFSGNNYVKDIIVWAKEHCKSLDRKYIRIDAYSDNEKLVNYYVKQGFTYLYSKAPEITPDSPKHYIGIELALLEIVVE